MAASLYVSQIDHLASAAVLPNLKGNEIQFCRCVLLGSILPAIKTENAIRMDGTQIKILRSHRPKTYAAYNGYKYGYKYGYTCILCYKYIFIESSKCISQY